MAFYWHRRGRTASLEQKSTDRDRRFACLLRYETGWQIALIFSGILALDSVVQAAPVLQQNIARPCTEIPACLTLYQYGQAQSKEGNLSSAIRSYQLAYDIQPDPRLLFNMARLFHRQGSTAEAATYYQRFIDADISDDQQKARARDYLALLTLLRNQRPNQTQLGSGTEATPLHKKVWFWAIVGGAVATSIGVGLGVGLSQTDRTAPVDVNVYSPSFQSLR